MVVYRLASKNDNQQLIQLAAANGMPGKTALRIDRYPDFFALLHHRGDSRAFIAELDEAIIGSICISIATVYVNGTPTSVGYIGDFKVEGKFRRHGIGMELTNRLHDYLKEIDADLLVLTVAHGNTSPVSFFKNRPDVPDFRSLGKFNVYQFIGRALRGRNHLAIEPIEPTDELIQFMNDYYKTYQLGPVITKELLRQHKTFVIRDGESFVAAMTLSDMMPVKQNVITSMPFFLRFSLTVINQLSGALKWSRMPSLNKPVGMLYIRFFAISTDDKKIIQNLIRHAQHEAFMRSYSFVSIGVHEKHILNKVLSNSLKFTFRSAGMITSLKKNHTLIQSITEGIPFEDYSLV